eukprot:UN22491
MRSCFVGSYREQYMRCPTARNVIQKVYFRVLTGTLFENLPMLCGSRMTHSIFRLIVSEKNQNI